MNKEENQKIIAACVFDRLSIINKKIVSKIEEIEKLEEECMYLKFWLAEMYQDPKFGEINELQYKKMVQEGCSGFE